MKIIEVVAITVTLNCKNLKALLIEQIKVKVLHKRIKTMALHQFWCLSVPPPNGAQHSTNILVIESCKLPHVE